MGIRINKSVGYGFQKFVEPANWEETMEKIYAGGCDMRVLYNWTKENYDSLGLPSASSRTDLFLFECRIKEIAKTSIGACVVRDEEFGIPGTLQLLIPGHPEFMRRDDSIDYCEECASGSSEPRFVELNAGIYPHLQGQVPSTVVALAHFLGIPEVVPHLKESLYVYWS